MVERNQAIGDYFPHFSFFLIVSIKQIDLFCCGLFS